MFELMQVWEMVIPMGKMNIYRGCWKRNEFIVLSKYECKYFISHCNTYGVTKCTYTMQFKLSCYAAIPMSNDAKLI